MPQSETKNEIQRIFPLFRINICCEYIEKMIFNNLDFILNFTTYHLRIKTVTHYFLSRKRRYQPYSLAVMGYLLAVEGKKITRLFIPFCITLEIKKIIFFRFLEFTFCLNLLLIFEWIM